MVKPFARMMSEWRKKPLVFFVEVLLGLPFVGLVDQAMMVVMDV